MYSKVEVKALRQLFWTSFGKSFPRKWTLYNTKIKGLEFKFHFDKKSAMVCLDIDDTIERRLELWEKIQSLQAVLLENYLPNALFEEIYYIDQDKDISRVFVLLEGVSINNKNTWQQTMEFLSLSMNQFESFFEDYNSVLED
ncbi:MAG: DUF4268 domain-containing protein [Flavobacteriaceae bacterium]|mgnify:FL=1|jgi:hypothetical protein|uniref:DUF4268 domain-containing protein n=1 Tax=uncultured Flavobacteriia bacterium TaxID=212695 RepID=H6RHP6_9BACT|nr:conserved hypothetical protein [uncultured bacterium]KRO80497.1 MAG: hypothetical protein ABR91_08515 [Polaribacter sp. BACL8 MAG-120531-bin13]KRP11989.1 MAG: hypothetical protein ABR93_06885 [Polaribacter sp. BACL8 MAG-120419-bin8]MBT5394279.1 DUF4268 domain-containing protein [Flavobacteriaceae bacterium]MDA8973176.1 DUF4268 domain-containing protein [bacterium]CCG00557.1 conserved hypothetical protein [uncultured Flavobacteriia bacterium]|tara:strand:+ start:5131 stop:5556 length:426 start_codon:yes stop_codon:yes gene_type:complete